MSEYWKHLLDTIPVDRPKPIKAQTLRRVFPSYTDPAHVTAEDGNDYVVKGHHIDRDMGRIMVNDHIVARLGNRIGAPVGDPVFVEITEEFKVLNPLIEHLLPGIWHGSLYIDDTTNRMWLEHASLPENRERFASLAILYGWMCADDVQVIYKKHPPQLVFSVDHGHFLPGSTENWTVADLEAAPPAEPYSEIVRSVDLTKLELRDAAKVLAVMTDIDVARTVGIPPDAWGITMEERVALARFIADRRDQLVDALL